MVDYEQLRRTLVGMVGRFCPALPSDRREDCVQNAMLRLHRVFERERRDALPMAYVRRCATTTVIDEIRKTRARPEVQLDEEDSGVQQPSAPVVETPERRAQGRQIGERIQAALGDLLPPRRRAVTLRLVGYTVPECAKLLGLERKQADNLIYRGMADLRAALATRGIGADGEAIDASKLAAER